MMSYLIKWLILFFVNVNHFSVEIIYVKNCSKNDHLMKMTIIIDTNILSTVYTYLKYRIN